MPKKASVKTPEELEVFRTEAKRNLEEAKLFAAQRAGEEIQNKMRNLVFSQHDREDIIIRNTDIVNRVYDFRGEVKSDTVRTCLALLSTWRRASSLPITIVLDSPGGTVKDGLRLYDFIRFISAKDSKGNMIGAHTKYDPKKHSGIYVTTMAMGDTSSIAVAILQAGNRRVAAPSASLMIHEVSAKVGGSISDIGDTVKSIEKDQSRVTDLLAERASIPREKLVELTSRRAHWMNSKEAAEIGLVDVIGYQ